MKKTLITLLLGLVLYHCFAQTRKIDSIKRRYENGKDQKDKLKSLLSLCDEYESLPEDTLWHYALKTKLLAATLKNQAAYSLAVLAEANSYSRWDDSNTALSLIRAELAKYDPSTDSTRKVYFRLAEAQIDLISNSSYTNAMAKAYSLLHEAELYKDTLAAAENMNSISAFDYDLDIQPQQAKNWLYKALKITAGRPQFTRIRASAYLNLSDHYWWYGQEDSAMYCVNKALSLSTNLQNLFLLGIVYQKRAAILIKKKQYTEARQAILTSLDIGRQIDGDKPQQDKLMLLASLYRNLKAYDKAIKVMNDGLLQDSLYKLKLTRSGKKTDPSEILQRMFYYDELSGCYKEKGDFKNYSVILEKMIAGKDQVYKVNSASAIAELQTKYEVQKKEATINRQNLELTKKNYLVYGSILALVLMGIIAWLVFKEYHRRQRALTEVAVTDAEENERRRIAADLHDNLGAQLSFIKRNVEFLLDQPEGFEPSDEQRYLNNLKDIAKGAMIDLRETIWVLNKEEVWVQEFVDKLKFYLHQQLPGKNQITWEIKEMISNNWQLSSGEVMHLFRIVQELISNILKHSQANHITIEFTTQEVNWFTLTICDNGIGFCPNEQGPGHYGLHNIKQRAHELMAELYITSDRNGTCVSLEKRTNN